jgi:hypothetical protein
MMYMTDARQSASKVEQMHCHKLRLANGRPLVVTREWWDVFLRGQEKCLTNESASTHTPSPEGHSTHGLVRQAQT